jgi:hypothetical protein
MLVYALCPFLLRALYGVAIDLHAESLRQPIGTEEAAKQAKWR